MEHTFQIKDFSAYDNYTHKGCGDNVSDVLDAILRVTTKITEHYASDILYNLDSFRDAVKSKMPWHGLLMFREGGVALKLLEEDRTVSLFDGTMYQQYWTLDYEPGKTAVFKRVSLSKLR